MSGWVPVNDRLIRRERGREREREERESVTQSGWALSDACNVRQPVSDKASTGDAPMVFVYPLMIDSSLRERGGGGGREREREGERESNSKRVGSDACQIRQVLGMLQRCPGTR